MKHGYILAFLGVLFISPDSLLIRFSGNNPFDINIWRGILGGVMIVIYNRFFDKRSLLIQLSGYKKIAISIVFITVISQMSFVYGIVYANVTDVLIILSFAPLLSTILSYFLLKDDLPKYTWSSTTICCIGVTLLLFQPNSNSEIKGLVGASICALTVASQFVIMKSVPNGNFISCTGLGNVLGGFVCLFFADNFIPNSSSWLPIVIMVIVVMPIPYILFISALKTITPSELTLIMLLETILGSIWVWFFLEELPSKETVISGIIVILTLFYYLILTLNNKKIINRS